MVNSKNNHWLALFPQDVSVVMKTGQCRFILIKTTHLLHIMVFGGDHEQLWCYASIHLPTWYEGLYQVPHKGDGAALNRVGSCWKTLYLTIGHCDCHTNRRIRCWLWENFFDHISSVNLPDGNSLWLFYVKHNLMRHQWNVMQYQRWTEGKDNGSIYQFEQGDCWKGLQGISIWRL